MLDGCSCGHPGSLCPAQGFLGSLHELMPPEGPHRGARCVYRSQPKGGKGMEPLQMQEASSVQIFVGCSLNAVPPRTAACGCWCLLLLLHALCWLVSIPHLAAKAGRRAFINCFIKGKPPLWATRLFCVAGWSLQSANENLICGWMDWNMRVASA